MAHLTHPQSHATKPNVLVIDDSVDVHRLLNARLKGEPIDLQFVSGGREGLDAIADKPPAIVMLDLDMPDLDGYEVLRELKSSETTQHIPVIVLSGMTSSQDKVMAFDLGAHDFIAKPFDILELRVRLRAAIRLHSLLQMLQQRAQIDGSPGCGTGRTSISGGPMRSARRFAMAGRSRLR